MPASDRNDGLPQANGWNEYKRLVLAELERLDKSMIAIAGKHDEISRSLHTSLNQTRDTIVQQLTEFSDQMHGRITANEARITVLEVRLQRLEADVKTVTEQASSANTAKILSRGQMIAAVIGMVITALMSLGAILAQLWK
jgi:hypothetical protein